MKNSDTPETNHAAFTAIRIDGDGVPTDFARKLERERDDAIVEATNAVNDIIAVRYQRDRLAKALKFIATDKIANAADMRCRAARALESFPDNDPGHLPAEGE